MAGIITGFVVLFLLSAFFSGAETSITATGTGKLRTLQETGKYRFLNSTFQWLIDDTQEALTVCLIANNVVNISASALASSVALEIFGAGALVVVVPVMTVLIVIFGEILPKSAAMVYAEHVLIFAAPILRVLAFLIAPIAWAMKKCVTGIGLLLHIDLGTQQVFVTRDEIEQFVKIGEESGALEASERRMIDGIIDFDETRVHEIMIPRTDMIAIEADAKLGEAVSLFIEEGHSRIPVYEESPDNIVGILYVKDTLKNLSEGNLESGVRELLRKPIFVPETIRTAELLENMRREHIHIAIIVDEYGGVAGIVTMEDILEQIVGEIQDEYDEEAPEIQKLDDGSYMVQGIMSLEDLNEELGTDFHSDDAETIGGLVLILSGSFPDEGEVFHYEGWTMRVAGLEDHRITLLNLSKDEEVIPE
ncbi:MAG: HlyC/CorC family transporter [Synergistaceae bacterium]|nr:HlyC/CorC family transporter [Synergistaceae bacterium]MBQ3759238.1 HlyC/CorC family transporter [Synergistaceae bacterium]MBQ6115634.1 HlyC/CorC family transporter [Synergistaceae bacterium]MBQ6417491.1 HlyC/CorC family transporter [Synergistaceae bacterium]MBQ6664686.1 HlyC/CorC family transporter [Synergistaceae bacterium]